MRVPDQSPHWRQQASSAFRQAGSRRFRPHGCRFPGSALAEGTAQLAHLEPVFGHSGAVDQSGVGHQVEPILHCDNDFATLPGDSKPITHDGGVSTLDTSGNAFDIMRGRGEVFPVGENQFPASLASQAVTIAEMLVECTGVAGPTPDHVHREMPVHPAGKTEKYA